MKYSFLIGLLLGFIGVLAAAGGYAWVQHPRVASQAEVVPNGGRAERFVIRLPADRIGGFTADGAHGTPVPRPGLAGPVSVEQFKIRNADGRVIGIAARHAAATGTGRSVAWVVSIPSRGALMLADSNGGSAALETALEAAGYVAGTAWEGELTVGTIAPTDDGVPQFSAGTAEFARLDVGFTESWTVTGVDARGALRGTLELGTISSGRGS